MRPEFVMRLLTVALLLGLCARVCVASDVDTSRYYNSPPYNIEGVTPKSVVDSDRFVEIPKHQRDEALKMLSRKSVVALSADQEHVLLQSPPDIDVVLDKLAERIRASIASTEAAAKDAAAKDAMGSRDDILEMIAPESRTPEMYASQHSYSDFLARDILREKEHVEHVLSLRGKLNPYLIKLSAHNVFVGLFSGWMEKSTLHVSNQLFVGASEYAPYPVIVYLENEPEHIDESRVPVK